jgi:hypothetical protein
MQHMKEVLSILRRFEHLGTRSLPNGTQLIGHVPHLAPEAYLHVVFPGLKKTDLSRMEMEIGRSFSPSLLELYSSCNGMTLFSGSLALYGLRTSYARTGDAVWQPFSIAIPNVDERLDGADQDAVFFGTYDWDGSLLYTSPKSPVVYRCTRDSTRPLNKWPSVQNMLLSEVRRIDKLFDANGKPIDDGVPTTP